MNLCKLLTVLVALFGLTLAEMTPRQILANHNSMCIDGLVAGLLAECAGEPCSKQSPVSYDASQIRCYTPLQRSVFISENGSPRACSDANLVIAYGDDMTCLKVENVVRCERPLYCIWAKNEDIEKWNRPPLMTRFIEDDYPREFNGTHCDPWYQVPYYQTAECTYTDYSSICEYDYVCHGRVKTTSVRSTILKFTPAPPSHTSIKCPAGKTLTRIDTCYQDGVSRDVVDCTIEGGGWTCLSESDKKKPTSRGS